jgi:hypothetical protein
MEYGVWYTVYTVYEMSIYGEGAYGVRCVVCMAYEMSKFGEAAFGVWCMVYGVWCTR